MHHAKGDLEKSEEYFSLGKKALDEAQLGSRDVVGYARFLAEYADVLVAVGKPEEAIVLKQREKEILDVFPGRTATHAQTPYGKFCDQLPE